MVAAVPLGLLPLAVEAVGVGCHMHPGHQGPKHLAVDDLGGGQGHGPNGAPVEAALE
jgi:hypothetical protein